MNDPIRLRRVVDVTGAVLAVGLAVGGIVSVREWFGAGHARHVADHRWLSSVLAEKEAINRELEIARRELEAVETRLQHAIERVPDRADEAAFLAEVVELFDRTAVELRDYRTGRPVTRETHGELDVTISGTCRYEGLCRALAGLKDSPRAGRVVRLDVELGEQDEEGLEFELTWRLYSRHEDLAVAEANDERR